VNVKSPFFYVNNLARWLGFGGSAQASGEQFSGPLQGIRGVPVQLTEDSAMAVSAVFGAVRILAETVSGVPLHLYRMKKGQWIDDPEDELTTILTYAPNPHMTAQDFWESMMFNLGLRGNAYAYIMRNTLGMPIGLYPMASQQVQPIVLKDGSGWYIYTYDGEQTMFGEEDVLHIRIFGNGRVGLSPLQYGAMSMGVAVAADQYSGQFFSRGGKPGGVLQIDRLLTQKQRQEIRENFKEVHEGADAAHKLFVLEAGMKYQQVQLKPEDLQMIESRRYNVKDVARFFGVPAFLLNESEGSTSWGTGLEQQMLGFYGLTIAPYCRRIASTCHMKLIPLAERRKRKIGYDYDELMAVDLRTRAEYYTKLRSNGIITANEVRLKLGLPLSTEKNSDSLLVQGAMMPLAKVGETKPTPNPSGSPLPNLNGDTNAGTQESDPVTQ
jgi:HK97 family phage portal protein